MDQLTAMRVFSAVVETGNFTRAAVALTMPKATVTTTIKALEAHLGTSLLERTTRRVAATPEGLTYYRKAQEILEQVDALDHEISGSIHRPGGRLRVEMSGGIAEHVVLPRLAEFKEKHPGVVIDFGVGDRFVDYMADQIDCAIRVGKPSDPALVARKIGAVGMMTYASPDYLARFGMPRHPSDLANTYPCIAYLRPGTGIPVSIAYHRSEENYTVVPHYQVSVSDSRSAVVAGVAGLGVVQTSPHLARASVERGEFVAILEDWKCDDIPLYLTYARSRRVNLKTRLFMDWLIEIVGVFSANEGQKCRTLGEAGKAVVNAKG